MVYIVSTECYILATRLPFPLFLPSWHFLCYHSWSAMETERPTFPGKARALCYKVVNRVWTGSTLLLGVDSSIIVM